MTLSTGRDSRPFEQRLGFRPAVRLDVADDDIGSRRTLGLGGRQHGVRLADAGRVAEEDSQLAAAGATLFVVHAGQQGVGIGPLIVHRFYSCDFQIQLFFFIVPFSLAIDDRPFAGKWDWFGEPIQEAAP